MGSCGLITFLSDFGGEDVYVGVIKGVVAQVSLRLRVIDLTHQIPPQDLRSASFQLLNAYGHFPAGTVHLAVVDPGVGHQRRAIALQIQQGWLVGPDNGLFSGVLSQSPAIAAVELTRPEFWYTAHPSSTFHGRDIFAPVAAHLAAGVALEKVGVAIAPETLVQFPLPTWQETGREIIGTIQAIDHFGNLITTIPARCVADQTWSVVVGDRPIPGVRTYADASLGTLLGLIGSHGWVEIAVNRGNAQQQLQQYPGDRVRVILSK